MAIRYVKSSATGAANGTSWTDAYTTLAAALTASAAGDVLYVSHQHAQTQATAMTMTSPGTATNPVYIICVDDSAQPPVTMATTATVTTTGANAMTLNGAVYVYGITFSCASGATSSALSLATAAADVVQYYQESSFVLGGTSTQNILIGASSDSTTSRSRCVWENCSIKYSAANSRIGVSTGSFHWKGGSILTGHTASANGIVTNVVRGRSCPVLIEGVDLSNLGTSAALLPIDVNSGVVLRNCKLPANWTGTLPYGTTRYPYSDLRMFNCDSADTNIRVWTESYSGTLKHTTSVYRSGGAESDAVLYSWALTTNANPTQLLPLTTLEIVKENTAVDSPITVSIDILRNSVDALTDADIWLEVQYLGTSGYPLSTTASTLPLFLSAPTTHPTSSETWTDGGMANPNKQKLSATITPQEIGFIHVKVCMAIRNTTVYVDPKIQVS